MYSDMWVCVYYRLAYQSGFACDTSSWKFTWLVGCACNFCCRCMFHMFLANPVICGELRCQGSCIFLLNEELFRTPESSKSQGSWWSSINPRGLNHPFRWVCKGWHKRKDLGGLWSHYVMAPQTVYQVDTFPETNSSPLKINGWKMNFPFGMAYFQVRAVSFRECSCSLCIRTPAVF